MAEDRPEPRLVARFDKQLLREDLAHATEVGRRVAEKAVREFQRDGVPVGALRRCDPDHRGGTRLVNCVKCYLPTLADPWRMVFEFQRDSSSGDVYLAFLAFGIGHPARPWQPSAYQVAHRRLHPED